MKKETLTGADYLLLLFYLPGKNQEKLEPIEGRTRITKMMFLFQKEWFDRLHLSDISEMEQLQLFNPYDYGPFSTDVHEQLELFISVGFLEVKKMRMTHNSEFDYDYALQLDNDSEEVVGSDWILSDREYEITQYSLSKLGGEYVEEKIIPELGGYKESVLTSLSELKRQVNSTSLSNILSYVYSKYPEYAEKSKIKEKVLRNANKKF